MTISEVFIRNVNKILKDNDMSQADLARALNMSPQQLSKTMTLVSEPSLSTVEAIADALGVTVSQILSDKSPKLVRVKQIEIDFEKAIDFVAEALKKNQDRFDDLASRIDDLEKRI